jgi:hypothetical protein
LLLRRYGARLRRSATPKIAKALILAISDGLKEPNDLSDDVAQEEQQDDAAQQPYQASERTGVVLNRDYPDKTAAEDQKHQRLGVRTDDELQQPSAAKKP